MQNTIDMSLSPVKVVVSLLTIGVASVAHAEPYAGVGLGKAAVELNSFDENDSAHKLIVGYIFDLPVIDFSVEANYVDFGSPNHGTAGTRLDLSGLDAFAVAGIDFGLSGLFAKAGVISWDADGIAPGFSGSDDGTDSAYGVGARFKVFSVVIRTEYEKFDIDAVDDLNMFSASVVWRF
jgi:hypothetical protein